MLHQARGIIKTPAAVAVFSQFVLNHQHLFGQHLAEQRFGNRFAVAERFLVVDPLPDGSTRDFGGGRIFHQTINRYAAITGDPRFDVLHRDTNVGTHTFFSTLTFTGCQQLFCGNRRIFFTGHEQLIFVFTEYVVEHRHCGICQSWMGNPCAVMTVIGFQRFVRFYLGQNLVVTFRIFAGNERGHAAHRERAAFMTGFNQQTRIRTEEWLIHRHHLTVRQHAIRVVLQGFDITENVVPATAVQAHNVVTQRVQNFVHLENGWQRFNQQGRFNCAARQIKAILCIAEHFAPPCRFLPGLRFG